MDKIKLLLFLILITSGVVKAEERYTVDRDRSLLATTFTFKNENSDLELINKKTFQLALKYENYDSHGNYLGEAVSPFFSLGTVYAWKIEVTLFDEIGLTAGSIQGETTFFLEDKKFMFYDRYENLVAIGYYNKKAQRFDLIDPCDSSRVLATTTRKFSFKSGESWQVANYYPETLSPFMLKFFVAFVFDRQNQFLIGL